MTAADPGPPAPDERILRAGTNARFALLLVLLVASSGAMLLSVLAGLRDGDSIGCLLAAGADADHPFEAGSALRRTGQALAYLPCVAQYDPPVPWWQILTGPAVVLLVAAATTVLLPRWKERPGRCVRLELIDGTGAISARIRDLAAGRVDRVPALFVAPAALSRSGAVFGTDRSPRLRLNAGLVACRDTDPRTFDAVVLHELGHVANRDLTITYATVALWRAFLVLVVCPYLVFSAWLASVSITSGSGSFAAPVARFLILPLVIAVVLYVVRADVLRSRELHADLTARRWGAPLGHVWAAMPARAGHGRVRRWAGAVADRVRTHPKWEVRRDALADPAPLFSVSALLMFLIGVIATLTNVHLISYFLPRLGMLSGWVGQAVGALPAVMVSVSASVLMWRAAAWAAVRDRRPPTGLRGGLWLGAGMVSGSLLNGQSTGDLWLPRGWWALAVVVVAATGYVCWTTQCARLAAVSWPGRSLGPPLTLCLVAGGLVLAAWFSWWDFFGVTLAHGVGLDTAGVRQGVVTWFPGEGEAHPGAPMVMVWTLVALATTMQIPLVPVAAVVAWAVPFVLWAAGRTGTGRGRAVADGRAAGDHASRGGAKPARLVPSLRWAVWPALGGGAVAALGIVGVQASLHALHAAADQRGGPFALGYALWTLAAVVLGSAAAAVVAVLAPGFRLQAALIASGLAALLGLGGAVALISADGCFPALTVLHDGCGWRPAWRQLEGGHTFRLVVQGALLPAPVTAMLVTAVAALVRRALHPLRARRAPRAAAARRPSGRARAAATSAFGGFAVAVALATATVLVIGDAHAQLRTQAQTVTPASQASFRQVLGMPDLPVPARMRRRQVHAWYRLGGRYLLDRAIAYDDALQTLLNPDMRITPELTARMRPLCVDLQIIGSWEPYYFRVPDPAAQDSWHQFGVTAVSEGRRCAQALDRADLKALISAVTGLTLAAYYATDASVQVKAVIDDPLDSVFTGPPVQPAQPRL
ncbi:M48 family metalloprotease [Streptomyces sp. NPDC059982]|uniref:M48 family metalloprotease n=1 Tax=Streptomyces sp. NPDC059982 TaxID=3347024 RepID=UPI003699BDB3